MAHFTFWKCDKIYDLFIKKKHREAREEPAQATEDERFYKTNDVEQLPTLGK
jgi:hypothetical protein